MHGDQQTEVNAKIECKVGVNWSILQDSIVMTFIDNSKAVDVMKC